MQILTTTVQPDTQNNISQIVAAITIGVLSAVGAFSASRAAKRGKTNQQALQVPIHGAGDATLPAGPVLAQLQLEIHQALEASQEMRAATKDIATKVETLQLGFARHEGTHEGMMKDLERLMRRIYKENGGGT